MNERLDLALKPSAFDWSECSVCHRPIANVPLSPDPHRVVMHLRCLDAVGAEADQ